MRLPHFDNPRNYEGLYVYDFGDRVAVGYTAEEIEVLQDAPEHSHGRAFRIHRVSPEGEILLQGLSRVDMSVEEGLIFFQDGADAALADFEDLRDRALQTPPPCPLHWHLARDEQLERVHFTMLSYEAEHSAAVGRWLLAVGFSGGVRVDSGRRVVAYYRGGQIHEEDRLAIAPDPRRRSRPRGEVLAAVDQPVQRRL